MRRRRQLSNRILASVVVILTASTLIGFGLSTFGQRAQLEREYQQRALAIAETFAAMPSLHAALVNGGPSPTGVIQRLAQQVRRETGATYIVVIDRHGVRYSHPRLALIGQRITEPVVALDGHNHLGVDHGLLGPSASARVPIRGRERDHHRRGLVGDSGAPCLRSAPARPPRCARVVRGRPRDRRGGFDHARAAPEAQHVRARTGGDRLARAGARGDAARHSRRGDHSGPGGPGHPRQRRGPAPARPRGGAGPPPR